MAQNDEDMFEDGNGMEGEESPRPRRKKATASSGTNWGKVILILLGIGAVSLALCCGVGYYFARQAFDVTEDPAKIATMQQEIVTIDLPQGLQPKAGMDMNLGLMKMRMVMYSPDSPTSLMLMQMQITGQTEEQMQQAFRQQAGQQQQNAQFKMESSETKTVKVDGEDRDFIIAKGTMTTQAGATPVRMVTGMFPAKGGMGFIQYSIDETTYSEEALVKTLESIHK